MADVALCLIGVLMLVIVILVIVVLPIAAYSARAARIQALEQILAEIEKLEAMPKPKYGPILQVMEEGK